MHKTLALIPVVFLTACAVTDDPGQGGFISGIYGVTSGAYDKRLEDRQRNLEALKQAQQGTQLEQQQLHREKVSLAGEVAQLGQATQAMDQTLEDFSLQLSRKQAATKKAEQRKQSLLKKAKLLRGQTLELQKAAQSSAKDAQAVQKLHAEEQRLQKEIKALQSDLQMGLD